MLTFASAFLDGVPRDSLPSAAVSPLPASCTGFIVTGPPQSGKSSFAFQAAVNAVIAATVFDDGGCGGGALVLARQQTLNFGAKLPRPATPLESLSVPQLERIEFTYAEDFSSVRRALANVSNSSGSLPSVIIVDDEGMGDVASVSGAKTLAVLDDTVRWLRDATGGGVSSAYFVFVASGGGGAAAVSIIAGAGVGVSACAELRRPAHARFPFAGVVPAAVVALVPDRRLSVALVDAEPVAVLLGGECVLVIASTASGVRFVA